MKLSNYILILPIALLFMSSCSGNDAGPKEPEDPTLPIDTLPNVAKVSDLLILNEGWYGHDMASLNVFNTTLKQLETGVFKSANPGSELGVTAQCMQIHGGLIYIVSKQGTILTALDSHTYRRQASLAEFPSKSDGRAFCGIGSRFGVVTLSRGAYSLKLEGLEPLEPLRGVEESQCGSMIYVDGNLYLISESKGLMIYGVDTLSNPQSPVFTLKKEMSNIGVGFVQTHDRRVWCVESEKTIVGIDPTTLDTTQYPLPAKLTVPNTWGTWNMSGLAGSSHSNALYFTHGGHKIYRFDPAKHPESLTRAWITTSDDNEAFYGASLAVNPTTGNLAATLVGADFNDNRLLIFTNQTETIRHTYDYYWFPAMMIFR